MLNFSLIESKLILPAHLAHTHFSEIKPGGFRERFNHRFFGFVNGPYRRFVTRCVEWRYAVLAVFIMLMLISVALLAANYVRMIPTPNVPHDYPIIKIEMNENVSDEQTISALQTIESVVKQVDAKTRLKQGKK